MGKRKTFDEILMERYGTNTDESTGGDEVSYDDVMLDRRLRGKYSDEWNPKMTKNFNKGCTYHRRTVPANCFRTNTETGANGRCAATVYGNRMCKLGQQSIKENVWV